MTSAVFIHHELSAHGASHVSSTSCGSSPVGSLPVFSPPSACAYSGALGVAGASPPHRGGASFASGDKANPYLAAKKFWKRLCFDPALDPTKYRIGFIESVQQPERKSGAEAWSMRLHDRLCELPYERFVERFCGSGASGDAGALHPRHISPSPNSSWPAPQTTSDESASDVPYHRIAYFKHGHVLVWESEYHKRRLSDLAPPAAALGGGVAGGAGALDGMGAGTSGAERPRRSCSVRDGIPPLPAASAGWLSLDSIFTPPLQINLCEGAGSGSSPVGVVRSPRGASPRGSNDGLDGFGSDDGEGDLQLLLEEEEDVEDEEEEEVEGDDVEEEQEGGGRSPRAAVRGGSFSTAGAATEVGDETPPPLPQLPEECWMAMMQLLGVRDVCMVSRTCRWLRQLAADPGVWRAQHCSLWGCSPNPSLSAAVVRRVCRRSELRAARWLEARVSSATMGFASTTCLQMDDSKVVSGDGNAVRLWEHATGRRISTLQGHPGRVTCVAFDDSLLVSGCAASVVKLWSMDDLRCRRTLRGHEGAVRSCCLLPTGIPVSGADEGLMRLWDVTSGTAIVTLEAGAPVLSMQAHGPSGHLVCTAGGGVQIWDVSTATLLNTLGATEGDDISLAALAGGAPVTVAAQHPYTCVSYMGDLLAAGRQGEVVLLDLRVSGAVGRLTCQARGSGGDGALPSGGVGAIAAAAGGGGGGGRSKGAPCVAVQMDEWKLVCCFNDGRHLLHLHDIRSLPRGSAACGYGGACVGGVKRNWHEPLMTLKAPSRINTVLFHEQSLLVGLEGTECVMWRFEDPATSHRPGTVVAAGRPIGPQSPGPSGSGSGGGCGRSGGSGALALGSGCGSGGGSGPGGAASGEGTVMTEAAGGGRKEKKKPAKVAKKQTRYPKRNTK